MTKNVNKTLVFSYQTLINQIGTCFSVLKLRNFYSFNSLLKRICYSCETCIFYFQLVSC